MSFEQALVAHLTHATAPLTEQWAEQLQRLLVTHLAPVIAVEAFNGFTTAKAFNSDDQAFREIAERMARDFVADVRAGVDRVMAEAMIHAGREGLTPDAIERMVTSVIGPTQRDAAQISRLFTRRYMDDLAAGVPPVRALRNADAAAARARSAAIKRRARTVVRTEMHRAQQMGRREGYRQAAAEGMLPPNTRRVWQGRDPCDFCRVFDGTSVPWDDPFQDVGDPPAHPNCRCVTVLQFPKNPL